MLKTGMFHNVQASLFHKDLQSEDINLCSLFNHFQPVLEPHGRCFIKGCVCVCKSKMMNFHLPFFFLWSFIVLANMKEVHKWQVSTQWIFTSEHTMQSALSPSNLLHTPTPSLHHEKVLSWPQQQSIHLCWNLYINAITGHLLYLAFFCFTLCLWGSSMVLCVVAIYLFSLLCQMLLYAICPHLSSHSPVGGQDELFKFEILMNKATLNLLLDRGICFLGTHLGVEFRLQGMRMFSFSRYCETLLQKVVPVHTAPRIHLLFYCISQSHNALSFMLCIVVLLSLPAYIFCNLLARHSLSFQTQTQPLEHWTASEGHGTSVISLLICLSRRKTRKVKNRFGIICTLLQWVSP